MRFAIVSARSNIDVFLPEQFFFLSGGASRHFGCPYIALILKTNLDQFERNDEEGLFEAKR